jgi:hypothetical protein
MANYDQRFDVGMTATGLEPFQPVGWRELENVDLSVLGAVRKRTGADALATVIEGDVTITAASIHSVAHRGAELCLFGKRKLYSRRVQASGLQTTRTVASHTHARLREVVPHAIGDGDLRSIDVVEIGDLQLVIWSSGGSVATDPGVRYLIRSVSGNQREGLIVTPPSAASTNARSVKAVLNPATGLALIAYVDSNFSIRTAVWDGTLTPLSFTVPTGATAAVPEWMFDARPIPNDTRWIVVCSAGGPSSGSFDDALFLVMDTNNTTVSSAFRFNLGFDIAAVNISIDPEGASLTEVPIRLAFVDRASSSQVRILRITVPFNSGAPVTTSTQGFVALTSVTRVAIGVRRDSTPGGVSHEILAETTLSVEQWQSESGTLSFQRFWLQMAIVAGFFQDSGEALDTATTELYFVLSGASNIAEAHNSGYYLIHSDTREIMARSFTARSEVSGSFYGTGELTSRDPVLATLQHSFSGSVNNGVWLWGNRVRTRVLDDTTATQVSGKASLLGVGVSRVERVTGHIPRVLFDDILYVCKAGYLAMYDGTSLCPADFHEFPSVRATTLPITGGTLSNGRYILALTWEWNDALGRLHRSRPYITAQTITSGGTTNRVQFVVIGSSLNNCPNLRLVTWRSAPNGTKCFRENSFANVTTANNFTVSVGTVSDVSRRETLDQVVPTSGAVLGNDAVPATDMVEAFGGRLVWRDPERGSLVRHSAPRFEGQALSFSLRWGLEEPRGQDVTALGELDGRLVMFSAAGIAVTEGSGPDRTGSGSFATPGIIPSEVGAVGQAGLALIPQGLLYASPQGPRLLSRTLESRDIAEPVKALFGLDGLSVVRIVYNWKLGTAYVSCGSRVFRYHVTNRRWSEDTGRNFSDASVSGAGDVVLATSSALLRENSAIYTDGGVAYTMRAGTHWLRQKGEDGVLQPAVDLSQVTLAGRRLGAHGFQVRVYQDLDETTIRFQGGHVALTVTNNNAAGLPYTYRMELGGMPCSSWRAVWSDLGETNATALWVAADMRYEPTGRGAPAESDARLLVPSTA